MHYAAFVGVFEGFGDLARDGERFLDGNGTARDPLGQGRAFHKFP